MSCSLFRLNNLIWGNSSPLLRKLLLIILLYPLAVILMLWMRLPETSTRVWTPRMVSWGHPAPWNPLAISWGHPAPWTPLAISWGHLAHATEEFQSRVSIIIKSVSKILVCIRYMHGITVDNYEKGCTTLYIEIET